LGSITISNILESTDFIVEPFKQMIILQMGRDVSNNFNELILNPLMEYFGKRKEYRTINDVDKAIEYLIKINNYKNIKTLDEEELKEELDEIKDSINNYLEKNRENIDRSFSDSKAKIMISYWITNFDSTMNILFDSLDLVTKQKRKIIALKRQSKYTKEYIGLKLMNIIKAVFLVLFRIVEQIHLIINNIDFDAREEIDYLIEDLVYLKNIQRKNALLKY